MFGLGPAETFGIVGLAFVLLLGRLMGFGGQRRRNDRERW